MNENTIISKTALLDCIVDNNRFKTRSITAAQIGAEDFRAWSNLCSALHGAAYALYEAQENHAETKTATTALFNAVKNVLAAIGDLSFMDKNGVEHKAPMVIDDKFAEDLVALASKYAGKMGSDKAPELQFVESQIGNTRRTLNQYKGMNGVSPDAISGLENELEELQARKDKLMDTADMCKDKPMITAPATFRKLFEHCLGRAIEGQKAQSWEEYEAAKAARKAARKARHTAQKNA